MSCERQEKKRRGMIAFSHMLCAGFALCFPGKVCLGQPSTVSYQGELRKNDARFDGTAQFKFVILSEGETLWSNDGTSVAGAEPETFIAVEVSRGLFSIRLGEPPMIPLEADLLNQSSDAAMRVWVNTGDGWEQLSDQPISSGIFSLHSESADGSPGQFAAEGGVVAGPNTARLIGGGDDVVGLPPTTTATLTSDNDLVIGFRTFQGNNPLPIDPAAFPNYQVGIGTLSPTSTLDIQGQIRIRGGNPEPGKVLTSDANGLASWQSAGLPAGAIILFAGDTCPAGFTRWSALDGKFLVAGPTYDPSAGGSNTHEHQVSDHDHAISGSTGPDTSGVYRAWNAPPGTSSCTCDASRGTHTHDLAGAVAQGGAGTTDTADSRPEFATILLCRKD